MSKTLHDPIAENQSALLVRRSARHAISPLRRSMIAILVVSVFVCGMMFPQHFGLVVFCLGILVYLQLLFYRLQLIRLKMVKKPIIKPELNKDLKYYPTISVLVPLKNEGEVIFETFDQIKTQNYPADKYEVLVLVEESDAFTRSVISKYHLPDNFRVILIPTLFPFTKARSLLHGLYQAKNEITTVFDAESRPDKDQFITAAKAINEASDPMCVQAIIKISNINDTRLSQFFAGEYLEWFEYHIRNLSDHGFPFGLGGNSFYIKTEILKNIGSWDPYNVTEDAELSVRLMTSKVTFKLIPSITFEQCPTKFVEWLNQRSRWSKGLLVTQITHFWPSLKTLRFSEWQVFWLRMVAGGLIPLSTLYIILFSIINYQFFEDVSWASPVLWIFFFISMTSMFISDHLSLKKLGIRLSFVSLLTGSFLYMVFYILAGFKAYYEYVFTPIKWHKTFHQ